MSETKVKIIASAIGRRKRAVASVRLIAGPGEFTINGKPAAAYFPGALTSTRLSQPFAALSLTKYSVTARAHGGGLTGQLEAVVLAISRALVQIKSDHKSTLRKLGLLTRDARKRQRRMVGTGGKARRQKQSPKR